MGTQLLVTWRYRKTPMRALKSQNSCFPDSQNMAVRKTRILRFYGTLVTFWEIFYGQKLKPIKRNIFNFDTCVKKSKMKPENAKTCQIY